LISYDISTCAFYTSFDIRARLAGSELVAFRDGHEEVITAAIGATGGTFFPGCPRQLIDKYRIFKRIGALFQAKMELASALSLTAVR
jgi:hypothetical protein